MSEHRAVGYNEGVKKLVLTLAVMIALGVGQAGAQQVNITAPAPPREGVVIDGILTPPLQYEITRPDDSRYLPPGPHVHHDPAFIEPLSVGTETGRYGVAGWTSPT